MCFSVFKNILKTQVIYLTTSCGGRIKVATSRIEQEAIVDYGSEATSPVGSRRVMTRPKMSKATDVLQARITRQGLRHILFCQMLSILRHILF